MGCGAMEDMPVGSAGSAKRMSPAGAMVAAVDPAGIAAGLGVLPGDRIVEICGRRPLDILDYLHLTGPEAVTLRLVKPTGQEWTVEIEKDEGEPLGITLGDELFDGVRECANDCQFCFVGQLPPDMRRSLYLRDDDLRLSVLHGNFVTLTNLGACDWQRLAEQRLSPLHVSIHTSDDALRRLMLGNPAAPAVLDQLRQLLRLGLKVHGQIVLVPGLNDGAELDRTLAELLALPGGLASLAVVPVGVTKCAPPGLRRYQATEARDLLHQLAPWQERYAAAGVGGLYAADEWYLLAGEQLPPYSAYDDFPQLSNGVGMTRLFERELLRQAGRRSRVAGPRRRVILATGTLFAPRLAELLDRVATPRDRCGSPSWRVVACRNELFGPGVTVAGLLGGADVVRDVGAVLQAAPSDGGLPEPAELIVVPAEMFRAAGDLTLDDYSPERLGSELGTPVAVIGSATDLVRQLHGPVSGRRKKAVRQ